MDDNFEFTPEDTYLNIDKILENDIVVTWSGGPDSTGLIRLLLEKCSCNIYPIFIDRGQTNYQLEKEAVQYYEKFFLDDEKFKKRFRKVFEVKIISPPEKIREFKDGTEYVLRNSDIINQGVRLALHNKINTVLLATFEAENMHGDGSKRYLDAKTLEVREGTGNDQFVICSPFHFQPKFPKTKAELFQKCKELNFDLSKTRSCYGKAQLHCGTCEGCTNRNIAFKETQSDPTQYQITPDTVFQSRSEKAR